MNSQLMTHVVAGYPSKNDCIQLLLGMQQAGVAMIEVQIPFSDPSADGPAIMAANDQALKGGMTIDGSFQLIKEAREKGLTVPVYIMSYANKLYTYGYKAFCKAAKEHGVKGFIVPDIPIDSPDYDELLEYCQANKLELVPVLSPGINELRLHRYLAGKGVVYITSMKGITGKQLTITTELKDLIALVRSLSSRQVALGFGIRSQSDVQTALGIADIAVIGSEIIRRVDQGGVDATITYIKTLAK